MSLWSNSVELEFFRKALSGFASPEQLFYKLQTGYFAYIPCGSLAEGQTLQSRNALIGQFTENWCKQLLEPVAAELNLFAVNSVVCDEIGLIRSSNADLALCTTPDRIQKPENIKLIFEIKMSVVSNYQFTPPQDLIAIGDYKQHKGVPSFTRSDSMLKAIGKAINIRVSGPLSANIPIIVLGNSPMSSNYLKKVDFLKNSGVIQGFWSLNPEPTQSKFIRASNELGFQTLISSEALHGLCADLLLTEMHFHSTMMPKLKLGQIIEIASRENSSTEIAEKFLTLIRN